MHGPLILPGRRSFCATDITSTAFTGLREPPHSSSFRLPSGVRLPPACSRGPRPTSTHRRSRPSTPTTDRGVIGEQMQYTLSVDEEVKKKLDDQLAAVEQMRKAADSFPPG